MGRLKKKGNAGAAKAYVTRSSAVKKLQCSLADFRRLCILKGIFPREPRNRKKANKGSSVPTSFYYAKDIAYLAQEPVLKKLREHKAFAKKLARALGRGEWSSAKSLEDNKPTYHLDHVIKERYPTFIDALRDIDDALCLVSLFSMLPSGDRLPPSLIENCSRLSMEWQLYIMHTRALRKVFLSIKGVYFQAEVMDQTITWLIPYQFTQSIPHDVDVRVMLTFLELYQTLLGFTFFKLYSDVGFVYPPPLDMKKLESAAGVGALSLQNASPAQDELATSKPVQAHGKHISTKDVRQAIKDMAVADADPQEETVADVELPDDVIVEDEFTQQPSKTSAPTDSLPTLQTLANAPQSVASSLFGPYTIFLSREVPRAIFEFIIRSCGGRVGWPASSGPGSPFTESDDSITHVVIDRPVVEQPNESEEARERRRRRKYVQPQWVVDSLNAGKVLYEEPYWQGKTLPPHLSPFGERQGAYEPTPPEAGAERPDGEEELEEDEESEEEDADENAEVPQVKVPVVTNDDPSLLREAELAAEAAGVDHSMFEQEVSKAVRRAKKQEKGGSKKDADAPDDMNKMMMSRKQKKMYEQMKYGEKKRTVERTKLEIKKAKLLKQKKAAQPAS